MLIFTWLIYILAEAKTQHYLIDKKHWKPNYLQLFIIRGISAILIGGLIVKVGTISEYALTQNNIEFWMYKQAAAYFIFTTTSFWILFDLILNYLRDRPWDYRGKTSGWLDRLPYNVWFVGKILALVMMVASAWYYITHA